MRAQQHVTLSVLLIYIPLLWRSLNVVCESGGYNDPPVPPCQKGLNELCATLQRGLKMEHETLQGGLKMEHETPFCTLCALCRRRPKSIEKWCRACRLCTFNYEENNFNCTVQTVTQTQLNYHLNEAKTSGFLSQILIIWG
jgi:hypothetical protein